MKHANIAVFVPHNGCPHQCSFCNQRTISGQSAQPTPDEVAAILAADLERAQAAGLSPEGRELAFFGGSFTAIERGYIGALLDAARPYLGRSIGGIRCSTRPDCIDGDVLELLRSRGVTAVELGAQSMDDRVLTMNRRGHTAAQVADASRLIRSFGLELGLQMMTGLYGDSDAGACRTAEALCELRPETVRIYPTVVLRGTELAERYESGEYVPQTLEGAVALCARLLGIFGERGIRVIRLGLHASREVEESYVAGAYHPALRELCESRLWLERMTAAMEAAGERRILGFAVNPRELSKALGQHRSNLALLRERVGELFIRAEDIPAGELEIIYE